MKIYLNLTNGIEALAYTAPYDYGFVRIQSTWCEQKLWDKILLDLDYDFLLHLALGDEVIVVDFSQHKPMSRALYQGVPWIQYALNRVWYNLETEVFVNRFNVTQYFADQYRQLKPEVHKKLNYFRNFLGNNRVCITTYSHGTTHDSDTAFYRQVLLNWSLPNLYQHRT